MATASEGTRSLDARCERTSGLPEKTRGPSNYSTQLPNYGAYQPPTSLVDPTDARFPTHPSGAPCVVVVGVPPPSEEKSLLEAYLLCLLVGYLGIHHFYLRRYGFGLLYLLTGGLLGIGYLVDLVRLPWLVRETNRKIFYPTQEDALRPYSTCDAYLLWFPLGFLGLHHYYLGRWAWGVAYTFTGGLFCIGWLVDAFRMPSLVCRANDRVQMERTSEPSMVTAPAVGLCEAYVFCLPPIGLFGAHHFRLNRFVNGAYYFLTLGGFGIGWIVDWFRMKWLVDRANHPERYPLGRRQKFVDDAYVYAFPLGLLGLHHFYLGRPVWGLVYYLTGGLFGIGWIVDLDRMPCLVRDANRRIEGELAILTVDALRRSGALVNGTDPYLPAGGFSYPYTVPDSSSSFEDVRSVGEEERQHLYPHPPPSYDSITHAHPPSHPHPSNPPFYGIPSASSASSSSAPMFHGIR